MRGAITQTSNLCVAPNNDNTAILCGMPVSPDGAGGVLRASSLIAMGRVEVAGICVGGFPFTAINGAYPGTGTKVAMAYVLLPEAIWRDVVDTDGLVPKTIYYLSATPGILTSVAPTSPGEAVVRVGVALSRTLLAVGAPDTLGSPTPPSETGFEAPNGEVTPIVPGTPIALSGVFAIRGIASSQALAGIVGVVSVGAGPTLPVTAIPGGPLELTHAEWDLVTGDVGGLVAGATYYLGLASGNLTTTPPSATGDLIAVLGTALDTNTLIVGLRDRILL